MLMRMCLFLFVLCAVACTHQRDSAKTLDNTNKVKLNKLDWMLGKWKREDTGELELWSKKEDTFFGGMMVKLIAEEKAEIQEILSLEGRGDGIYFSSKDKDARNIQRIEYKMSNENFEAPKFSNPANGFPKHISYLKIGEDKIKVNLLGPDGVETSFYYVREI